MSNEANANAETRVRAAWKQVTYSETGQTLAGPCYVVISAEDHPTAGSMIFMQHGRSKEVVFAAALAFTDARLEEVRLIEAAIRFLHQEANLWPVHWAEHPETDVIAKLLERELATARRGLRQNSERSTEDV